MDSSSMTPVDWAKRPIVEKYADFSGRAPRAEYWWFFLAVVIAAIVVSIVESVTGLKGMILGLYGPLTLLLWLATIVPGIAAAVRRLHDTNRSGWWVLLPMIPYGLAFVLGGVALMGAGGGSVGMMAGAGIAGLFLLIGAVCAIVLLVFMVLPGTPGDNRYGPNTYGAGVDTAVAAE